MVMYTFEKSLLHENDDELEYFRIIFSELKSDKYKKHFQVFKFD